MKIVEEKKQVRQLIKQLQLQHNSELFKSQAASLIFNKIEQLTEFQIANNILLYWSDESEVDTHNFIEKWYRIKNIYLPCIINETQIEFRLFEGSEKMKLTEKYKIPEPSGKKIESSEIIDMAIIPGLAFDINKNRMGRGKGYYDNFLKNKKFLKIGICFDYQILEKIPANENDIKMDVVISEKRVIL